MGKTWVEAIPAGVPANIDVEQYPSLVALLDESFKKYATRTAYKFMGKAISFAQVDDASRALAATCRRKAGQGRPCRGHDAQRAAVPSRSRRSCVRGMWSSTSTRCTRRASSSTS